MRIAFVAAILFAPVLAGAQPAAPASPSRASTDAHDMAQNDCARARALHKPCVLTIGPEEVEGGVVKPDLLDIGVRGPSRHASMIRIRREFIPEIIKTANEVE